MAIYVSIPSRSANYLRRKPSKIIINIIAARAEIAFDRVGGELLKSLLLSFFNGQVKEGRKEGRKEVRK